MVVPYLFMVRGLPHLLFNWDGTGMVIMRWYIAPSSAHTSADIFLCLYEEATTLAKGKSNRICLPRQLIHIILLFSINLFIFSGTIVLIYIYIIIILGLGVTYLV